MTGNQPKCPQKVVIYRRPQMNLENYFTSNLGKRIFSIKYPTAVRSVSVQFRLVSGPDPRDFLRKSGEGSFSDFLVSGYDDFLTGILLPSSSVFPGRIRREVYSNRWESARKSPVSGEIRPDAVPGIIDLECSEFCG